MDCFLQPPSPTQRRSSRLGGQRNGRNGVRFGTRGNEPNPPLCPLGRDCDSDAVRKKLTLVEAEHLVDRVEKQVRFALTSDLQDRPSRQDWAFADTLSAKDFETQIGSTVSRLQRFIRNQTMRMIFGQPSVSLDLGKAIEDGAIILVSLATERAEISPENATLFATLLLSDLWTAAQERGKRDGIKPFYVYLDEFQQFITPTISDNLDQARGFGLHLTMAHQFPNQLLDKGENGRRMYNSIMENASSKVVFRLSHEDNLKSDGSMAFPRRHGSGSGEARALLDEDHELPGGIAGNIW